MKFLNSLPLVSLLILFTLGGCKKDDPKASIPAQEYMQQGQWKVSRYQKGSDDETALFSGDKFRFLTDDNMEFRNASGTIYNALHGSWHTTSYSNTQRFVMSINGYQPFNELNADWQITEQNPVSLKLKHESSGAGGFDYLEFQTL
jgi:hypothetical protein